MTIIRLDRGVFAGSLHYTCLKPDQSSEKIMNSSMYKGTLKTWKDDRGFGFIKPDDDSNDIFVHISAFDRASRRPWKGDIIYYQIQQDRDGKVKAVNARLEGETVVKTTGYRKYVYIGAGFIVIAILAGLFAHYFGLL